MHYRTTTGVLLLLKQIPRRVIDNYAAAHQIPEPPTKMVQVFGGSVEHVPDTDNPAYQSDLALYYLNMADSELDVLAGGITVLEPARWENDPRIEEIQSLGIPVKTITDYLRYIALTNEDMQAVAEKILYMSTVTRQGIEDAEARLKIEWGNAPLDRYRDPPSQLKASLLFTSREAAREYGYTWQQFCELTGPEQSAVVAQYQCSSKIQWLQSEQHKK